jgi:hypothetical protein
MTNLKKCHVPAAVEKAIEEAHSLSPAKLFGNGHSEEMQRRTTLTILTFVPLQASSRTHARKHSTNRTVWKCFAWSCGQARDAGTPGGRRALHPVPRGKY